MANEKPILFSGEMVRAILEGRKTQTRRVVSKFRLAGSSADCQGPDGYDTVTERSIVRVPWDERSIQNIVCPYGQPGDRLWVRESMGRWEDGEWFYKADTKVVTVPSDRTDDVTALRVWAHHKESPHCPSIHMPRWASRITLEITKVRVERIQQISEQDAIAEGRLSRTELRCTWDNLNAKRGFGWDANPWVWVIEFKTC